MQVATHLIRGRTAVAWPPCQNSKHNKSRQEAMCVCIALGPGRCSMSFWPASPHCCPFSVRQLGRPSLPFLAGPMLKPYDQARSSPPPAPLTPTPLPHSRPRLCLIHAHTSASLTPTPLPHSRPHRCLNSHPHLILNSHPHLCLTHTHTSAPLTPTHSHPYLCLTNTPTCSTAPTPTRVARLDKGRRVELAEGRGKGRTPVLRLSAHRR